MRGRRATRSGLLLAAAAAVIVAMVCTGCTGADDRSGQPGATTVTPSITVPDRGPQARTSPFTVDVPVAYELVVADVGGDQQQWDSDLGSDQPFTAFAPEGSDDPADLVRVEAEAIEPDLGSRSGPPELLVFDDGRMAQLTDRSRVAAAVQVRAPAEHQAVFDELLAATTFDERDHGRAPEVDVVPAGWRALGHVDADLWVALRAWLPPVIEHAPGLPPAHALGWRGVADVRGRRSQLVAMALPAASADLEAVRGIVQYQQRQAARPIEVGGRPGLAIEAPGAGRTSVVAPAPWGDLLVVTSQDGTLSVDDLVAVAASARVVDGDAWQAQRVRAFGGGGELLPDPGRVVLAVGEHDGVRWLLQDDGAGRVDPCIKDSTLRRTCLRPAGSSDGFTASTGPHPVLGDLLVVATPMAGAAVRVTVGDVVGGARLVAVPGGPLRVAVVVDLGLEPASSSSAICREPAPTTSGVTEPPVHPDLRVDVLDVAGHSIGCFDPYGPP